MWAFGPLLSPFGQPNPTPDFDGFVNILRQITIC